MVELLTAFGLGAAEMGISARLTRAISREKIIEAGMLTIAQILLWFYVVSQYAIDVKQHLPEVAAYTVGAVLGVMGAVRMGRKK